MRNPRSKEKTESTDMCAPCKNLLSQFLAFFAFVPRKILAFVAWLVIFLKLLLEVFVTLCSSSARSKLVNHFPCCGSRKGKKVKRHDIYEKEGWMA